MFNEINKDVTIIYPGGSGGFLLYFLFLLTDDYISGDPLLLNEHSIIDNTFKRIYEQFPDTLIKDSKSWKNNEFWPNNFSIKYKNTDKQKLFLICNPFFEKGELKKNLEIMKGTFIIFLYTNINLHLRLAYDKQAYWFTNISRKVFNAPESNFRYLRLISSDIETFDGKKVYKNIPKIIKLFNPEKIIDLNDIYKIELNYNQKKFLNYWYNLQTEKSKRLLKWKI